ncbi:MAG: hypothetical protein OK422_01780 [Thaumarchaeota archaeon]|nr:hypothetical protein [Nitrososphaerota archaeon]
MKRRRLWPRYTEDERSILRRKFLGHWENLDFLEDFWNLIWDERDLQQYRRVAKVWRLRQSGKKFGEISKELGVDPRKACALFTGYNCRPYLVHMYLNRKRLGKPRPGWKWILERTPKPTDSYPKHSFVPNHIRAYQDILDFLAQFPVVPEDNPALKFFGLATRWVGERRAILFGFLLGFLVGDAGKQYADYEYRSRHYAKTAMCTNMARKVSNVRLLRYVQLTLASIGLSSRQGRSSRDIIRWNSVTSNILTWIINICLGLDSGGRTSLNPVKMNWLLSCPRGFLVSFFQGLADSDGYVNRRNYYVEISSVPNSQFYVLLLKSIGVNARFHPKADPRQVRMPLYQGAQLPIFNPLVASYRFREVVEYAQSSRLFHSNQTFMLGLGK